MLKRRRKVDIRRNGKPRREVHQGFTILALSSLLIIYQQRLQLVSSMPARKKNMPIHPESGLKGEFPSRLSRPFRNSPRIVLPIYIIHSCSLCPSFKSFRVHFRDIYVLCVYMCEDFFSGKSRNYMEVQLNGI